MRINLTATKSETGGDIHIWADIFPVNLDGLRLIANPVTFRINNDSLYALDAPDDPIKGALLTVSVKEAKALAEKILKLVGE